MIVPQTVRVFFEHVWPWLEPLRTRVEEQVRDFCTSKGYAYVVRIKTLDSFAEKAESGRYRSLRDVEDLCAAAIIIPTLAHEKEVIEFLSGRFAKVSLKQRQQQQKAPDVFRFDSTRFVGNIVANEGSDPNDLLFQLLFEIQIRTAFEHAWAVTTHALTYKSNEVNWKRLRLSAQLKAMVEQLDLSIVAFETTAPFVTPSTYDETRLRALVASVFGKLVERGVIPTVLAPKDWSRFSENAIDFIRSTERRRIPRREFASKVVKCLQALRSEAKGHAGSAFPLSVSLGQWLIGVLMERMRLTPASDQFLPLITDQLTALYPAAGQCRRICESTLGQLFVAAAVTVEPVDPVAAQQITPGPPAQANEMAT